MGKIIDDPNLHHRRSIRLPGYDYSEPGAYHITIVTHEREHLFGKVFNGEMRLSPEGEIVREIWNSIPSRFPKVELGEYVIMPNHFHAIVIINVDIDPPEKADKVGAIHELPLHKSSNDRKPRRRMMIPMVVGYYKMNTAKRINESNGTPGFPVWQRNYYEHIIQSDDEYATIDAYIASNPDNWIADEEYS